MLQSNLWTQSTRGIHSLIWFLSSTHCSLILNTCFLQQIKSSHIHSVKLHHELYPSVNRSIIVFRTNKNTSKHPKLRVTVRWDKLKSFTTLWKMTINHYRAWLELKPLLWPLKSWRFSLSLGNRGRLSVWPDFSVGLITALGLLDPV